MVLGTIVSSFDLQILVACYLTSTSSINVPPCTDQVDLQVMNIATNILRYATPSGYNFDEVEPQVVTARNPHTWRATFTRNDNVYEVGCAFLTSVKKYFKRSCLQGSEIRVVILTNSPNGRRIAV